MVLIHTVQSSGSRSVEAGFAQTESSRATIKNQEMYIQHLIAVNNTFQNELAMVKKEKCDIEKECLKLRAGLECTKVEAVSATSFFKQHEEELVGLRELLPKLVLQQPSVADSTDLTVLHNENSSRKTVISQLSTENAQQMLAIEVQKSVIEGQVKTIEGQKGVIVEQRRVIERRNSWERIDEEQKQTIEEQKQTVEQQKQTIEEQRIIINGHKVTIGLYRGQRKGQSGEGETPATRSSSESSEPLISQRLKQAPTSRKRKPSNTATRGKSDTIKPRRSVRQIAVSLATDA